MGGRGASSGINSSVGKGARELGLTNREIDRLTDTAIDFIRRQDNVYGTLTAWGEKKYREQIKREYNAGYSGLEDGRLLDIPKPNLYLIKRGEKAVAVIRNGRYGAERVLREYDLTNDQKKLYLRRAILLKLRPTKR